MAENLVQISDYQGVALQKVMQQYKQSKNLLSVVDAASRQSNDLEQALFELRDGFWLDTAVGVQLDVIGSVFNEPRNGRLDAIYRVAIAQKASTQYSGTPEDVIAILRAFYGATYVYYSRTGIAEYLVETDAIISDAQLDIISPAGVRAYALTPDRNYLLRQDNSLPVALMDDGFIYLLGA